MDGESDLDHYTVVQQLNVTEAMLWTIKRLEKYVKCLTKKES
jgi:hypothetical protein